MDINTVPQLICHVRQIKNIGDKTGKCCFCGYEERGVPPKKLLKKTFTSFELLQEGQIICIYCQELYTNPEYRRKSWLITPQEFRILKREDYLSLLSTSLPIPYAIYITTTGKKHGWIQMIHLLNYSTQNISLVWDLQPLTFNQEKNKVLINLAISLRKEKITKQELLTGELRPTSLSRLIEKKKLQEIQELKAVTNTLNWEFILLGVK